MSPGEFHYRPLRLGRGVRPGAHPSSQLGGGHGLQQRVPLLAHRDPRRLDLRASFADPFGIWQVRVQAQRSSIPVYAVVDLSGSMGFQGVHPKMAVLADFLDGLAASAHRHGDSLGLLCAAESLRPEFCLPPTRRPQSLFQMTRRLRQFRPPGAGSKGLAQAWRRLPNRRCLVFLLSDFHMPLAQIDETLRGLTRHDLVPVVLWDQAENLPARSGIARLTDLETGGQRLMLLRSNLRERLEANVALRRERLMELLRRHGRSPLFLTGGYSADQVTRHFLELA